MFIEKINFTLGFLKDGDENKIQNLSINLYNVNRVVHSGSTNIPVSVSETAIVYVNNDIEKFFRERFEDKRFLSIKVDGSNTYYTAGLFGKTIQKRSLDLFNLFENEYDEDFLLK